MSNGPPNPHVESTAYHEAGHAVASALFGIDFDTVHVFTHSTKIGEHWYYGKVDGGDQSKRYDVLHVAVDSLAGPIADARFRGCDKTEMFRNQFGEGDNDDVLHARKELAKQSEVSFAEAVAITEAIVNRLWPAVEAIATALIERGTLQRDEVQKMFAATAAQAVKEAA